MSTKQRKASKKAHETIKIFLKKRKTKINNMVVS